MHFLNNKVLDSIKKNKYRKCPSQLPQLALQSSQISPQLLLLKCKTVETLRYINSPAIISLPDFNPHVLHCVIFKLFITNTCFKYSLGFTFSPFSKTYQREFCVTQALEKLSGITHPHGLVIVLTNIAAHTVFQLAEEEVKSLNIFLVRYTLKYK